MTSLRFYETAAVHQEAKLKKREKKTYFFRLLTQNVVDLSIFYGTHRPPPDSEKSARHLRSASDGHSGRQYAGSQGTIADFQRNGVPALAHLGLFWVLSRWPTFAVLKLRQGRRQGLKSIDRSSNIEKQNP